MFVDNCAFDGFFTQQRGEECHHMTMAVALRDHREPMQSQLVNLIAGIHWWHQWFNGWSLEVLRITGETVILGKY